MEKYILTPKLRNSYDGSIKPRRDISDADKELVVEWSQIRELAKTNKM